MRELTTDQRTVRVIRAYSLISPAPSLQESFFFRWKEPLHSAPGLPDAGLILKKLPPVGKSFLLINTPFVLLIYLDLKQNSPWCKTKVREFTTDHRTVRVIRAYSLISPAPSLQESFFFLWKEPLHSAPGLPDAGLILKKLPPVGKSFLLINTPFVLLIYPDLKQNSPW